MAIKLARFTYFGEHVFMQSSVGGTRPLDPRALLQMKNAMRQKLRDVSPMEFEFMWGEMLGLYRASM